MALDLTRRAIRMRFPRVRNMSCTGLADLVSGSTDNCDVDLFDVRSEEEYRISHLAGSQRLDPDTDPKLVAQLLGKEVKIVVCYCSVGYRSASLADKLQSYLKKGDLNSPKPTVYNLDGSLFQWSYEGRPMVDERNTPTKCVHPYNVIWGKLLNADIRKSTL